MEVYLETFLKKAEELCRQGLPKFNFSQGVPSEEILDGAIHDLKSACSLYRKVADECPGDYRAWLGLMEVLPFAVEKDEPREIVLATLSAYRNAALKAAPDSEHADKINQCHKRVSKGIRSETQQDSTADSGNGIACPPKLIPVDVFKEMPKENAHAETIPVPAKDAAKSEEVVDEFFTPVTLSSTSRDISFLKPAAKKAPVSAYRYVFPLVFIVVLLISGGYVIKAYMARTSAESQEQNVSVEPPASPVPSRPQTENFSTVKTGQSLVTASNLPDAATVNGVNAENSGRSENSASAETSGPVQESSNVAYISGSNVFLRTVLTKREGPFLQLNDKIKILGFTTYNNEKWYNVDHEGKNGWVSARFVVSEALDEKIVRAREEERRRAEALRVEEEQKRAEAAERKQQENRRKQQEAQLQQQQQAARLRQQEEQRKQQEARRQQQEKERQRQQQLALQQEQQRQAQARQAQQREEERKRQEAQRKKQENEKLLRQGIGVLGEILKKR